MHRRAGPYLRSRRPDRGPGPGRLDAVQGHRGPLPDEQAPLHDLHRAQDPRVREAHRHQGRLRGLPRGPVPQQAHHRAQRRRQAGRLHDHARPGRLALLEGRLASAAGRLHQGPQADGRRLGHQGFLLELHQGLDRRRQADRRRHQRGDIASVLPQGPLRPVQGQGPHDHEGARGDRQVLPRQGSGRQENGRHHPARQGRGGHLPVGGLSLQLRRRLDQRPGQVGLRLGPGHRRFQVLRRHPAQLRAGGRRHAALGREHLGLHGRQGGHDLRRQRLQVALREPEGVQGGGQDRLRRDPGRPGRQRPARVQLEPLDQQEQRPQAPEGGLALRAVGHQQTQCARRAFGGRPGRPGLGLGLG